MDPIDAVVSRHKIRTSEEHSNFRIVFQLSKLSNGSPVEVEHVGGEAADVPCHNGIDRSGGP